MEKKVCLITGANSGIGKSAAIQLASLGFHVLIGSRSLERGNRALAEIKSKSESDSVELIEMDLSSKQSLKDAVDSIKSRFEKLDVLIHNAADFDISRKKPVLSVDGIETVWATNHIGPVLLTDLLMDRLEKADQARIITISSQGLVMFNKLKVDLKDPEFKERKFSVSKAYYQSKLAQVMYTYWLANKLKETKITVNCIRVTNVKIDIERYPDVSKIMKFMYSLKSKFSISADDMAKTYTDLASSDDLVNTTGKYFDEKNKVVGSSAYSMDENSWNELMEMTMKYVD